MKTNIRKVFALLFCCLFLCLGTTAIYAAEEPGSSLKSLCVGGYGVVTVTPDSACISMEISAVERSADAALEKATSRLSSVRELVAPYGELTQTAYYTHPECDKRYVSTYVLSLETTRLNELSALLERLPQAGVSVIHPVCFFAKDTKDAEAQALALAMENAKEKATALGVDLSLLRMEAHPCRMRPYGMDQTDLASGIAIECYVTAWFTDKQSPKG